MCPSSVLQLLFIPCLFVRGAYESASKEITFDMKMSRYPVAFSYPPALSHYNSRRHFNSYCFLNHRSLPFGTPESLPRAIQGTSLAEFRGRYTARDNSWSLLCEKSNSRESESSNKTASKIPSWETGLKQRMDDIDFSLMKNDLSLISIYSLGDSIVEVGVLVFLRILLHISDDILAHTSCANRHKSYGRINDSSLTCSVYTIMFMPENQPLWHRRSALVDSRSSQATRWPILCSWGRFSSSRASALPSSSDSTDRP
jgi:hypothetical protein